ncbi:MAG TPA: S-methyl-5'-thioinosine phosphorylase [Gammaproteobacteria bacterium]
MTPIGIIVGSGFGHWPLTGGRESAIETPYGAPSSALARVAIGECEVLALARHGRAHTIAPHAVNYRANVWALHAAGVRTCIGVNAVGAIAPGFAPGELAVPDQLIDYTWGRASTFTPDDAPVVHAEFTEPFAPELRGHLAAAAAACGFAVRRGVYGVMQGPRLETAAEIERLARDGCTMVGMTAMPEAILARELGMAYAICAGAVNHAAGRGPGGAAILAEMERHMALTMARISKVIETVVPRLVRSAV